MKPNRSSLFVTTLLLAICAVAILALQPILTGANTAGVTGLALAQTGAERPDEVILTYDVGGVLTADGTLWQYRPDQNVWLTIDEAFKGQGRDTKILPLPVPAAEIADMSSFGFILSKKGALWIYEFTSDSWRKLDPPK